LYYVLKLIASMVMFITLSLKISGRENVSAQGPFLVVSNHLSVSDPVIIGVKIKRQVIFLAKEELFRNWFSRYFVTQFGAIPVYRGSSNRDALRMANQTLKQGKVLGMFPEGKRSLASSLTTGLYGSALIAYHNRIPILPCGITGSERVRGMGWIWHRPKVTLTIGRPFYLPEIGHSLSKEQLLELTNQIMKHIAELLPENYKGQYSEREA
jgi:1-acyl-sn-glycerol-3-phosphate acyltransferase